MPADNETLNRILDPKSLDLPPNLKVDEIRWERIVDSLGDDALQIWIILDDATQPTDLRGVRELIHGALDAALFSAGIELFPYLRLATHAELAESAESVED